MLMLMTGKQKELLMRPPGVHMSKSFSKDARRNCFHHEDMGNGDIGGRYIWANGRLDLPYFFHFYRHGSLPRALSLVPHALRHRRRPEDRRALLMMSGMMRMSQKVSG